MTNTEPVGKERMAEMLRGGATAKDFDMKDGTLFESSAWPQDHDRKCPAHHKNVPWGNVEWGQAMPKCTCGADSK